jgi:hypothetical protein
MFKSLTHFFATAIGKFLQVEPKIEKVAGQVENAMPEVEAVTAAVPVYGPAAVTIEKAGEMALGAVVAVLHAFGAAAQQKLVDAGLDITAIETAADVYKNLPTAVVAMVKAK